MYFNDGKKVADRYGYNERLALYNWWQAFRGMERELLSQRSSISPKPSPTSARRRWKRATTITGSMPQKIMDKLGVVILSLLFYVVYTMWYGFGILFMFEGWGLQIEH